MPMPRGLGFCVCAVLMSVTPPQGSQTLGWSGQEGGVGGQEALVRVGAWLAFFCLAPFPGRTWPLWAMPYLSS